MMILKRFLIITICILLMNCTDVQKSKKGVAKTIIASLYESLDGESVEIEDFKGKRILLNG